MPLYEFILTTRCSHPEASSNLMRLLAKKIIEEGGNVRSVQILGDRILTKKLMGKEGSRHIIGRYIQILYDGYPELHLKIRDEANKSFEILRMNNFFVKDFISEAVKFKKPIEEQAPFIKNKQMEAIKYGEAIKILQENQRKL